MAGWSFVQGASSSSTAAGTTGISVAFGSNVTAGHVLVIYGFYNIDIAPTWTFSDTQTNSYTTLGPTFHQTTIGPGAQIAAFAIAGSTAACTPKWVNNDATSAAMEIFIGEFIPPSGTVSADGSATGVDGSTGTVILPAGGGTGTNDLLINGLLFNSSWASWGGAWASMGTPLGDGDACGYLLNASGSALPNATQSSSGSYASFVAALQVTGGGGGSTASTFSVSDPEGFRLPGIH